MLLVGAGVWLLAMFGAVALEAFWALTILTFGALFLVAWTRS